MKVAEARRKERQKPPAGIYTAEPLWEDNCVEPPEYTKFSSVYTV